MYVYIKHKIIAANFVNILFKVDHILLLTTVQQFLNIYAVGIASNKSSVFT